MKKVNKDKLEGDKKISRKEAIKKTGRYAALTATTMMFLMDANGEDRSTRSTRDKYIKPPKDSPKPPR